MARKKYGKHSKTPAVTSATARRSHVALGAATAVVGASLALGVTPAFAQTGATTPVAPAQPGNSAAQPAASANNKPANPQTPVAKQGDKKQVETKADKKQADTAEKAERGGYPPRSLPLVTTPLVTRSLAIAA